MTPRIDEVAPDLYRICVHVPTIDLQFNHFLVRDEEPLLFHTGMRGMFPLLREALATLIDPASLRWIGWSHFEVDECGALNEWLSVAPRATPVCGQLGAMININDFANRPPRGLARDEVLETGRHRFRFVPTPHLPHGWDAGVLFEEADRVLLCSDPRMLEASSTAVALDLDRLQQCLARLTERERMVVLLTFYADKTSRAVGKELGLTDSNVRVIRHRAIERLRACVTSQKGAS